MEIMNPLSREEMIEGHEEFLSAIREDKERVERILRELRNRDNDHVEIAEQEADEPFALEEIL